MPYNVTGLNLDSAKVNGGVVFTLGADASITLRPIFGPDFRAAWRHLSREPVPSRAPDGRNRDVWYRALAYGVVADWSNLEYTNDNGVVQDMGAYSWKTAYEAMKRIPGFAYEIEERASDYGNYR